MKNTASTLSGAKPKQEGVVSKRRWPIRPKQEIEGWHWTEHTCTTVRLINSRRVYKTVSSRGKQKISWFANSQKYNNHRTRLYKEKALSVIRTVLPTCFFARRNSKAYSIAM
jgi:hypothetical protein